MSDPSSSHVTTDSPTQISANRVSSDAPESLPVDLPPSSASFPSQVVPADDVSSESSPPNDEISSDDPNHTVISKRRPTPTPLPPRPISSIEIGTALEGTKLGYFSLEKFVGGGGMGAVFRAKDTKLDRIVAVKVLSRDHTETEILRRFKNEAQSAARLDHQNIARVHYVGEDEGWNYIVFEFIDGLNIRQLVASHGPLPMEEAIRYTLQVAEALEHASHRDVVHRDIKPSNVLVTPKGHVKLVDMGLARLHQVESPDYDLTASGVTLGTFDYISPEQARDPRIADVRSDLYSLGCTLYFMLTGRPPFPDGTVLQKLLSHSSDERPDVREHRPDVPDVMIEVLDRLLAKNPHDRFQRPGQLVGELIMVADQLGLHDPSLSGTVWVASKGHQRGWAEQAMTLLIPLAVMVLIVLLVDRFLPTPDSASFSRGKAKLLPSQPESNNVSTDPFSSSEVPTVRESAIPALSNKLDINAEQEAPGSFVNDNSQVTGTGGELSHVANNGEIGEGALLSESHSSPDTTGVASSSNSNNETTGPTAEELVDRAASDTSGNETSVSPLQSRVDDASTSVQQDQNTDSTMPIIVPPQRLVVGPGNSVVPSDAIPAESLETACRLLAQNPNVQTIELWFDGPMHVPSLELAVTSLDIVAGRGYSPQLVFQPVERDLGEEGRMIRVYSGDLMMQGIDFQLNLPAEPSSDWSLFHLHQMASLDLRDCTFTIVNASNAGMTIHEEVSFFTVGAPSLRDTMIDDQGSGSGLPSITLTRCIARGQATLVRAKRTTPFMLNWEQGLFVSSQRLVECGGSATKPDWTDTVQILLVNVTMVAPQGLCLMSVEYDAPDQLSLWISAVECIFLCDSSLPMVEHHGVQAGDEQSGLVTFENQSCYFPENAVIWELVPLKPNTRGVLFRIDDARNYDWFDLKFPKMIPLAPPVWTESAHLADLEQVDDYLLGHTRNAGFEKDQLPNLPRATPATDIQ